MSETTELFTGVEVYGPIPWGASSAPLLREVDYDGPREGFGRWASKQAEDPSILFVRGFVAGLPAGEWQPAKVAELRDGTPIYLGAASERARNEIMTIETTEEMWRTRDRSHAASTRPRLTRASTPHGGVTSSSP